MGTDPQDRHLDPLSVDELPLGRVEVGSEAGDRLVDGLDGMVADLGLACSGTVGVVLGVRRGGTVLVGLLSTTQWRPGRWPTWSRTRP